MKQGEKIKLENTKSEIVGIYDENDNYVGKDTRKNMRKNNLIHRCTDIVVLNPKNEILVQTRSLIKEYCPGYLDAVVGGVVGDGEDVNICAEREIGEEIGIDINNIKDKLKYITKHFVQEDICRVWTYCYLLRLNDEEIKTIRFKDHEITSIEWISKKELLKLFEDSKTKITQGSKQTILLLSSKGII
jgi:isopentenyldiphosphate isomerase